MIRTTIVIVTFGEEPFKPETIQDIANYIEHSSCDGGIDAVLHAKVHEDLELNARCGIVEEIIGWADAEELVAGAASIAGDKIKEVHHLAVEEGMRKALNILSGAFYKEGEPV